MSALEIGDKVESLVHFLKDEADADFFNPDDRPEDVDVWPGRRGTVIEVSGNDLKVRWSHRKWVDGWLHAKNVRKIE